jgi:ADP-ribosylglycohydrolase
VNEYDFAAGMALVLAAGGVLLDAEGRDIELLGDPERRVSGLFAGRRDVASRLQGFAWKQLEEEPRRPARVSLGYPRKRDEARLSRAAGCLLGAIAGESLHAPRDLHTLPGQPADAGEMALVLCRSIVRERAFEKEKVRTAYRDWLQTRPVDVGATTERGLLGLRTTESESNSSLARVAPIGIWAAGDPARAAATAREDCALTHPNPLCLEACAGYAAAIAAGVAGGDARAMRDAALAHASGAAREAIAAARPRKGDGSALASLGNAFASLALPFEEAIGDAADHNDGAIAGALFGAARGRESIPPARILDMLACRPLAEAGALRPRAMEYWPDDVLDLAEALLQIGV